jgi:hypothetical protein
MDQIQGDFVAPASRRQVYPERRNKKCRRGAGATKPFQFHELLPCVVIINQAQREGLMAAQEACPHVKEIKDVKPSANGCEECLKMGDTWVHLRMCLICGHVGCCDSSKNKHATKHFHRSKHPIMQSIEPGEDWRWCFVDEIEV